MCSENKGADQLRGNSASLFSHMQKNGFLTMQSNKEDTSWRVLHVNLTKSNLYLYSEKEV